MRQVTIKKTRPATPEERRRDREVILAVLAKAADDSDSLARLTDNPSEALNKYYTLTREEVRALVGGDLEEIKSWLGKLDQQHRTWLTARLAQEKW